MDTIIRFRNSAILFIFVFSVLFIKLKHKLYFVFMVCNLVLIITNQNKNAKISNKVTEMNSLF